jgi:hypothetical protein
VPDDRRGRESEGPPGPPVPTAEPPARRSLRLLDLAALTVGFGLASLLTRAFLARADWGSSRWPPGWAILFIAMLFLWLGLAMSGPIVLLVDRPGTPEPGESSPRGHTWAELAWLVIGFYWIALTVLVVPVTLPLTPWLGVFPIVAALALRMLGPRQPPPRGLLTSWTHRLSVNLLLTWPLAWVAMVLVMKAVL